MMVPHPALQFHRPVRTTRRCPGRLACPVVRGYVNLPAGWERVSADGPGPFVTSEVFRRPDGTEVRWQSRAHRKARRAAGGGAEAADHSVWWRPRSRSWWMAVLFSIGSL